jgi:hypothetical protein
VHGYRSFTNVTEGKIFCVMEAENREAVQAWFQRMGIPCEALTEVELEGERGLIRAA